MAKTKLLTPAYYESIRDTLSMRLSEALDKERIDGTLPEVGTDFDTDLWELPPIDSKSVVKLSPILKELTGHRLDPRWIRKGGYDSVTEAIQDLLMRVQTHCVSPQSAGPAVKPPSVAEVS